MIITVLCGILLIMILVTIHEMGHLLVARAYGVGVEQFAFGFGPGFKMFTVKGIPVYFRFILLGGYVRLKTRGDKTAVSDGKCLEDALWWQKILIFVAGIGFNLITAVILRTLMYWFAPADTQVVILSMKFQFATVATWYLAPLYALEAVAVAFAIYFLATVAGMGFMFWKTLSGLVVSLWLFITGLFNLAAPTINIAPLTPIPHGGFVGTVGLGANAHFGVWSFIGLLYLVSLLLAALNMAPLMPFDGGHITVTLVERIFGKNRFSSFVAQAITYVGFIILAVLLLNMLMSDASDLLQFINKK
ncbi:MAG: site-2 protease family protein [Patescibacteria group bacterium]